MIASNHTPLPALPRTDPQLTVLIVDDIEENLELLEDVLSEYGYHTVRASNGSQALTLLGHSTVHLIVADAMMPRMDGFQLCKEVKSRPALRDIPFIIYTGDYIDEEDRQLAQHIGADRYVMKTGGVRSLIDEVNALSRQVYGFGSNGGGERRPQLDDRTFLEQHHAVLVKKIEQKMGELELYAEALALRNRDLQASESRYRSLFESANIAIYVLHRDTARLIDVNTEGMALLGYSKEELWSFDRFPGARDEEVLRAIREAEGPVRKELTLVTKDGRTLPAEVNMVPLLEAGDKRVLMFARDITEERRIQSRLLQMEKMTVMGRLASGIAHEIRNPLAAITLNVQFLLQKLGASFADREALEGALEGAYRIQQVIEKTLSLARPSPPQLKEENLNDVVRQVLWFVGMATQQKQIRIQSFLDDNLPTVCIDARQIQQVFLNIFQNAIDASPDDSSIVVRSTFDPGRRTVCVTVRDYGIGISEEQYERLFEPFSTTKANGTGLGLTLSKYIMDRHHAEIALAPAPAGGTIVTLTFPTNDHGKDVS